MAKTVEAKAKSETLHCSFVKLFQQGQVMIQFNNAVLTWLKFRRGNS